MFCSWAYILCLIIVFLYFINDQFNISKLLRYLQTSYLAVVSGSEDHLESVSKWLINYLNVHL